MGITTFPTLEAAIRAGFAPYDRMSDGGWLVRIKTTTGFALAIVKGK